MRGYSVQNISENGASFRVDYFIDDEFVGYGIFATSEQADQAGIEFMFGNTP
jgi:hypothetical protein